MKNLIAMIGLALLASCSPEEPASQLEERQQRVYQINSQTPFNGTSVDYHDNGQLNARIKYHRGMIVDGPVERYHDNGQLQESGVYKDGQKHGVFKNYFGNGDLWLTTHYLRGKKHGIFETYHENTLMFRLCYQDDVEVYMPSCGP